ncbi:MAG: redoxin domain-containing protein [Planctomycetales bacterium]|nr:redoxin domain-containing protein [Planctomycetales bacterium]
MNNELEPKAWMKITLFVVATICLLLGAIAVLNPVAPLKLTGLEANASELRLWQILGAILASFGLVNLIAARSPYLYWPIALLGLMATASLSVFIVVGTGDDVPLNAITIGLVGVAVVFSVALARILWGAAKRSHAVNSAHEEIECDDPVRDLCTNTGVRLDVLSNSAPQLVVFLRHAGCTFCRQALADIAASRQQILATGCGIVFVHLGEEDEQSTEVFRRYGLDDLPRISDPQCRLYRQFGLDLGGFSQLFGLRVWLHGLIFGVVNGHGIGAVRGNSFQMPGVYLYHCGVVLGGFRHQLASDRPDYVQLARQIRLEETPTVLAQVGS